MLSRSVVSTRPVCRRTSPAWLSTYNVDLFTANDVSLPAAGWTWDEFIAAAEALTQDTDGDGQTDVYGVAVEPTMYRMAPFVWSAGGEIVDDLDNPTMLTLDTPEALEGLEKFISLGVNGHNVVPSEEEVAAEEDGARFMRGGAAMFLQSRREVPTLRQIEGFTWDVAPLPVIDEAATVLHSDAFCMAARAENKDAIWAFVEYAAGEEGQQILAETGRIVPVLESVAQSDVFLQGVPIENEGASGGDAVPVDRRRIAASEQSGLSRQHHRYASTSFDLDLARGRGRLQR